jgi:hypothetical protein
VRLQDDGWLAWQPVGGNRLAPYSSVVPTCSRLRSTWPFSQVAVSQVAVSHVAVSHVAVSQVAVSHVAVSQVAVTYILDVSAYCVVYFYVYMSATS